MKVTEQFEEALQTGFAKLRESLVDQFGRALRDLQDENEDLRSRLEAFERSSRRRGSEDAYEQSSRRRGSERPPALEDRESSIPRDRHSEARVPERSRSGSRSVRTGRQVSPRRGAGRSPSPIPRQRGHQARDRSRSAAPEHSRRERSHANRDFSVPKPPPPVRRSSQGDNGYGRESTAERRSWSRDPIGRKQTGGKGGGGKGKDKGKEGVCFLHLIGKCRNGDTCKDRHPDKEECSFMYERIRTTPCRFGADCTRAGCVFQHPPERREPRA